MKHNIPPASLGIETRVGDNPITHRLKCWNKFFRISWAAPEWKPFEIRRMDRDYRQDDLVILYEYNHDVDSYSGRRIECRIREVLTNAPGIEDDYCILLLKFHAHASHFPEDL